MFKSFANECLTRFLGSEMAFNDSITSKPSAESSCHRIVGGDGERHVKQQISLHQDGDVSLQHG